MHFLCRSISNHGPREWRRARKEPRMKRIDAVIRQGSLDQVRERLTNIGVEGLTLPEVIGFGRQKGHSEVYRGCGDKGDFHPKLLLTIVAPENQAEGILDDIVARGRT